MPMKPKPLEARYGRWTVLDPSIPTSAHATVRVLCDCGTLKDVLKRTLTQGRSTSCGCRHRDELKARSEDWVDLAPHRDTEVVRGARFGRWTALTIPYGEPGRRDRVASCRCDCGNEKVVVANDLLSGRNKSCGCLRRDTNRARNLQVNAN